VTNGHEGRDSYDEPVTITDKRRVDPETGEVRETPPGPAPSGSGAGAPAPEESGAADAKVAELTADLQRVQADFANYRKRAQRDQQVSNDRAKASVVTQLLPILDDLDRARSHGDLESGPLKAVADKLAAVFEGLGLTGFGAEGDEFDPALHEAVQHEGDGSHPVVGTVMRRGYKLGDQVVRHAMVGVVDTDTGGDSDGGHTDNPGAAAAQAAESDR
jgi:molecular chaperone GrpE